MTFVVFPDGWYFQGGAFYKYFSADKTWMEAEAFCKTIDAELAVIPDMGRNEFVYRNLLPPAKQERSMFITTYFFF